MKKTVFIEKHISFDSIYEFLNHNKKYDTVHGARKRDSENNNYISVEFGDQHVHFDSDNLGTNYEAIAQDFCSMLQTLIDDKCSLQEEE